MKNLDQPEMVPVEGNTVSDTQTYEAVMSRAEERLSRRQALIKLRGWSVAVAGLAIPATVTPLSGCGDDTYYDYSYSDYSAGYSNYSNYSDSSYSNYSNYSDAGYHDGGYFNYDDYAAYSVYNDTGSYSDYGDYDNYAAYGVYND